MTQILVDNASTLLNGSINAASLTMNLLNGSAFPAVVAPDFMILTLTQNGTETSWEKVKVTAHAEGSQAMTIERAQEGSTALPWESGSKVSCRTTAALLSGGTLNSIVYGDLADTTNAAKGDALIGVKQPYTGAAAITQHAFNKDWVSILQFGAVGGGVVDDWAAIKAAIDSGAERIYVPPGNFRSSKCLNIKRVITLYGASGTQAATYPSKITFDDGVVGIFLHRYNTNADDTGLVPYIESPTTTGADGSTIKNLAIYHGTGSDVTRDNVSHGIWMKCRALIEDVAVAGFAGNAIHLVATAGNGTGLLEGNANNFDIARCRLVNCANGLYVDGADVNAGMISHVDASSNDGTGFLDSSFLGNTYVACHTNGNGTSYSTDNANARNVFLGCYAEGGQLRPNFVSPTIVIGGFLGSKSYASVFGATGAWLYGDGDLTGARGFQSERISSGGITFTHALGAEDGILLKAYRSDIGSAGSWRLRWDTTNLGDLRLDYQNSNAQTAIRFTGGTTALTFGRATALPFACYSPLLVVGSSTSNARLMTNGSAAPTSGEYAKGDIIWNYSVAAAGSPGWVCTTAGTAGSTAVFKTMAVVAA